MQHIALPELTNYRKHTTLKQATLKNTTLKHIEGQNESVNTLHSQIPQYFQLYNF